MLKHIPESGSVCISFCFAYCKLISNLTSMICKYQNLFQKLCGIVLYFWQKQLRLVESQFSLLSGCFFNMNFINKLFSLSLEQIKSFEAPATINSASLHPAKECLVAGGEDFKLYKYDYNTGEELGMFVSYIVKDSEMDINKIMTSK